MQFITMLRSLEWATESGGGGGGYMSMDVIDDVCRNSTCNSEQERVNLLCEWWLLEKPVKKREHHHQQSSGGG